MTGKEPPHTKNQSLRHPGMNSQHTLISGHFVFFVKKRTCVSMAQKRREMNGDAAETLQAHHCKSQVQMMERTFLHPSASVMFTFRGFQRFALPHRKSPIVLSLLYISKGPGMTNAVLRGRFIADCTEYTTLLEGPIALRVRAN